MNIVTNNKWIGQRTIRPDGADKVTGRAAFAADTNMPGMIWGKVLRSPHPHARIRGIDTSKAEALPGVKAVVTARDIVDFPVDKSVMLGIQDMRWMCRNVMAREKALFPGHPVAAVAATSEAIAAHACELIEVDYEVLPWAIEIDDALKPDAPILHEFNKFEGKPSNIAGKLEVKKGDIEQGFKEADVIVERSFTTRPVHQGYIEPHACLISVAPDNKTTIWSSSQGQFMVRAMVAYLTGIPQSDIRAIPAEIGGGFGGKTIVYLEPLATLLAKKSGRPVKMVMTREEVMRATGPTSGSKSTVKIGAKKDGRIVAAQGTFYLQAGALPGSPIRGAVGCSFSPYDIPNVLSTGYDVLSNRSKVAAYRAPGAPIGAFAVECVLDELAEALKMDPLDLRLKNAAKQGTKAAHGPVFPRIGYVETFEAAKAHPHDTAPLGKLQGRGVASGFWFNAGGESPPRSTSPRTATSSSPPAIPTSAARARRSPISAPSCWASTHLRTACPTCSPVVANHHRPGRLRCPRNDANPRTGATRSNATFQQPLSGSRRGVPSASMNSTSTPAAVPARCRPAGRARTCHQAPHDRRLITWCLNLVAALRQMP